LRLYNDSPYQLLSSVYPEYTWSQWRFSRLPKGFNFTSNYRKEVVEVIKKELDIKNTDDWNQVKYEVIKI
jgi:hypothetical protein